MKRNLRNFILKLFRPSPHKMERRMKRGYKRCGALNLREAEEANAAADIREYEKWILTQPDSK